MKALTLTQPWATLVALGHKKVETRSWSTSYRGPLAIHAAKGFPADARAFAEEERALGRVPAQLPLGAVVATARLVAVRPTFDVAPELMGLELRLGNYARGRFAWLLEDVVALPEPIPAKGALQLWTWEPDGPAPNPQGALFT